jgi:hypothetical protein
MTDTTTMAVREAFREGWMVNAVPPEEHEAGADYVLGCEEADWRASKACAALASTPTVADDGKLVDEDAATCPACQTPIYILTDGSPDDLARCQCTIVSLEWLRIATRLDQPSGMREALERIKAIIPVNCGAWTTEQDILDIIDAALSQQHKGDACNNPYCTEVQNCLVCGKRAEEVAPRSTDTPQ